MDTREDNPGTIVRGNIAFSNGERSWTEQFDVVEALAGALEGVGHEVERYDDAVVLPGARLTLLPRVVGGVHPLERSGVRTQTTIEIHHPGLFPEGVFEYQHSTGDDVMGSLRTGFEQFAKGDLVAVLDAIVYDAQQCTHLQFDLPADEDQPKLKRRIVLGPVTYYGSYAAPPDEDACEVHPPFCTCCLFTNTWSAFEHVINTTHNLAIRLYAMREDDGTISADCRINGLDHEPGAEALRAYAAQWEDRGFEVRKQYIVMSCLVADA